MLDIDAIKRRYDETASETDAFGRVITVRRLRNSEQLKAVEMAGSDMSASTIRVACGLVSITDDGGTDDFKFPRSRAELDARLDRLDEEGLEALGEATKKLYGGAKKDGSTPATGEAAKNS